MLATRAMSSLPSQPLGSPETTTARKDIHIKSLANGFDPGMVFWDCSVVTVRHSPQDAERVAVGLDTGFPVPLVGHDTLKKHFPEVPHRCMAQGLVGCTGSPWSDNNNNRYVLMDRVHKEGRSTGTFHRSSESHQRPSSSRWNGAHLRAWPLHLGGRS